MQNLTFSPGAGRILDGGEQQLWPSKVKTCACAVSRNGAAVCGENSDYLFNNQSVEMKERIFIDIDDCSLCWKFLLACLHWTRASLRRGCFGWCPGGVFAWSSQHVMKKFCDCGRFWVVTQHVMKSKLSWNQHPWPCESCHSFVQQGSQERQ